MQATRGKAKSASAGERHSLRSHLQEKKTMFRREPTAKMLQNTSIIWIQEALQLIFWSDV